MERWHSNDNVEILASDINIIQKKNPSLLAYFLDKFTRHVWK